MRRLDVEKLITRRFPSKGSAMSTHYEDCYRQHPACAYALGVHDALKALETEAPRGFLS